MRRHQSIPIINRKLIFLMSDQPTTCPKCGTRTDLLLDMLHTNARWTIEECLNPGCRFIFFSADDQN